MQALRGADTGVLSGVNCVPVSDSRKHDEVFVRRYPPKQLRAAMQEKAERD
jgi:hypothetical protein